MSVTDDQPRGRTILHKISSALAIVAMVGVGAVALVVGVCIGAVGIAGFVMVFELAWRFYPPAFWGFIVLTSCLALALLSAFFKWIADRPSKAESRIAELRRQVDHA